MLKIRSSLVLFVALLFFFQSISPVFAQGTGYLEDESEYLWEEQEYRDSTGREFETSDSQYVGEQEIKEAEDAARRSGRPSVNLAEALNRDKEMLPDNIVYGIGTGAVIGGWLALVQGKNARENVSYLSIGVLSGVLLGMAIGSKSLYIQQTPGISRLYPANPVGQQSPHQPPFQIGLSQRKNQPLARLDFQFKF